MSTWGKRIEAVFAVGLPIGEGSAATPEDPLIIIRNGNALPEEIIDKWLHYRAIIDEKDYTLMRKVYLFIEEKVFLRYDLHCCSHSFTEDLSRLEHLYFDLSDWAKEIRTEINLSEPAEKENIPSLFSGLSDYIAFYTDEDVMNKSAQNHRYIIQLRKCKDGKRWLLLLEDLIFSVAAGVYLRPFDPSPIHLHEFEEQCRNLLNQIKENETP
jgi:hypothetical protein